MTDAFAGVVEGADPVRGDVIPDSLVELSSFGGGGGDEMVENHHDPIRIEDPIPSHLLEGGEHRGGEDVVDQCQVDLGDNELARPNVGSA
jgi:hypothetical protein